MVSGIISLETVIIQISERLSCEYLCCDVVMQYIEMVCFKRCQATLAQQMRTVTTQPACENHLSCQRYRCIFIS